MEVPKIDTWPKLRMETQRQMRKQTMDSDDNTISREVCIDTNSMTIISGANFVILKIFLPKKWLK
jgi:hypothetical protein